VQSDMIGTFGEVLNAYRKQKHISQRQLAQRLGVHLNTISAWECGEYLPRTRGMVVEIANQLGLDQQATLHLLQASLTAVSSYWYVPHQRNPFFTGREAILHYVHEALGPESHVHSMRSFALTGLGGVGKTQTALEYAYRHAYDYTAVFWIDAETTESLLSSFSALAEVLGLPERHTPDHSQLIVAVQRWLSSHQQWLVIFDNVEDMALVYTMMPASWNGALLLTTQQLSIGASIQTTHLDTMNAEESCQFLLRRSRLLDENIPSEMSSSQLSSHDEQAIREVVTLMDGLPLALDQAGAYMEATRCSSTDLLCLLRSSQMRLLEERTTEADHPISVFKTFALAFAKVQRQNPFAADLLTVCAFLAPDAIPEALLIEHSSPLGATFHEAASDPLQFNTAIRELLTYSLIQRHAQTHTLTIHRLVQTAIADRLASDVHRLWVKRVLHVLNQAFPARREQLNQAFPSEGEHMKHWLPCEQLVPHVTRILPLCEQVTDSLEVASLLCKIAAYHLYYQSLYLEAELVYQRSLALWEQELGPNHQDLVEPLIGLAQACRFQRKYPSGILYVQRAIGILEDTQGSHHFDLIEPLNILAELHCYQRAFAEAEGLLLRALLIWVATIHHDYPDPDQTHAPGTCPPFGSGGSTDTINQSLRREVVQTNPKPQGEVQSTHALIQQAVSLWERVPQRHHWEVGQSLFVLGQVYQQQQRYQEAEDVLLPLHHIGKQVMGEKHPIIAHPLEILAITYKEQSRLAEAEQCYQQIQAILEPVLGAAHPWTREIRTAHAQLLAEMASAKRQQDDQRQALHVVEQYDEPHAGKNAELPGETSSALPACPRCHSNAAVIKSGTNRSNSPRFRCRSCQRYFTPHPIKQGYDLSLKQQALALVAQGKSHRSIARSLNVDHRTIGIWAKEAQHNE
jgi:transposase-like protein/transcriptional regulator with XRE-family HTH domain